MAWLTQRLIRALRKIQRHSRYEAGHLTLGRQGEIEAYFYLKDLGYRIVATNFRAPNDRGEIDIIGWDGDVLCFVEVKTRTDVSFAPPSAAVTHDKQRHILSVAKRYLRHMGTRPRCRFDILSAVPASDGTLQLTLRKGAFTWETSKARRVRDYHRNYPSLSVDRIWFHN
jgi:putative endonuclease